MKSNILIQPNCDIIDFFLLIATYLVTRPTDNGREYSSGRVVSGEPSLAHAGAIVDHEGGNVVVTHDGWLGGV